MINEMQYIVSESNFATVLTIWKNYLWPERIEPIEKTSALLFRSGIDLKYKSSETVFFKIEVNKKIIGVCSGQQTGDTKDFRSRGLWVSENFRRKGVATKLFSCVEEEAKKRGCSRLWTLARHSSKKFYDSMGMKVCEKTYKFEYGPHFWMSKLLNEK